MAHESHVASEQAVFCEPTTNSLSSVVPVCFSGRFDDTSWAEERAVDVGMMKNMDISASLFIGRSAAQETVTFQDDSFVVV